MLYYLSERPDSRIVLDREPCGFVLQKIEVSEPPVIRRGGEEYPQYHESFQAARAKVSEINLIETPEGWFRLESARKEYVRSRLGEDE